MQPWIKQQFGIEMSPNHISASRGDIQRKRKQAGKAKPAAKKSATAKAAAKKPALKPPAVARAEASSGAASADSIRLGDIEAVKGLVHRVGADQLRALVDLLAK